MKYLISIPLVVFVLFACNESSSNNAAVESATIVSEIEQIDSVTAVIEDIQTDIEQSTKAVDAALSELDF